MIKEVIGAIAGAIILLFSTQYIVYQLISDGEKLNIRRFSIFCIIQSIVTILTYYIDEGIIRAITMYILILVFSQLLYKKSLSMTILSSFVAYIMVVISETLFSFIVVFLLKIEIQSFKETFELTVLSNVCISIIMLGLIKINCLKFFLRGLIKDIHKMNTNKIIIIAISTVLSFTLLAHYIYFETNALYTMLLNLILILVYGGLSVMIFKENNDKVKIKSKYDSMISTSEKYEKAIEQLRMNNHENKNNLIVLKGMMKNENKKVKEYIDDLINDERTQDNNLLMKTNSIPTGGLQGLIYQKLLDMKQKNIEYHLEVSKDIDKRKIENIDVRINKDLCTIVGVFLDNAIQATENINKKNIGIYLYQEKNIFVISISNTYEGKMDLYKMSDRGYTTKSEGHGYGLSLVKEIIENNYIFKNERSICGNVFTQKIKLTLEYDNKK